MDKLKYVKLEQEDGTYSDAIPLAVDSDHVDISGNSLTNVIKNKADSSTVSNLQTELNVQKNRIDNLAQLDEGSTTGDAELIDARVGYNNILYDDLGESVRSQIDKVNNRINNIDGNISISYLRYGWNYVDSDTEPTVSTYAGAIHNSEPIHLDAGDEIIPGAGTKYKYIYQSDVDNKYYKDFTDPTTQIRKMRKSGMYYIEIRYTPETNIPNTDSARAILGEKVQIRKKENNYIYNVNMLKTNIENNYINGFSQRIRDLLKSVLENAVYTRDMSEQIKELDEELSEKGLLMVSRENKRLDSATNRYGVDSETMSILKDYYFNPTRKITFFIDNGGNAPERNLLVLLDDMGNHLGSFLMSNSGRTNVEWTMSADYDVYGFRLSLYNDYLQNCYAFDTNTGNIIFAGTDSIYAGKNNIYE